MEGQRLGDMSPKKSGFFLLTPSLRAEETIIKELDFLYWAYTEELMSYFSYTFFRDNVWCQGLSCVGSYGNQNIDFSETYIQTSKHVGVVKAKSRRKQGR